MKILFVDEAIQIEGFEALLAKLAQQDIQIVLCDVRSGLLQEIKARYSHIEVISLADYELEKQTTKKYTFSNMIGKSTIFLQAVDLAQKDSETDATVLLTGETGTGKEVFAQAIHQASSRKAHDFVALHCGVVSPAKLENELFGETHKGTVFLDEIGKLPINLQAGLLQKMGTEGSFRLISATSQDLDGKHFRQDLYACLRVHEIRLPALRERKEDIPLLVTHFLGKFASHVGKINMTLHPHFLECLAQYHWVGNTRELKNIIERAMILAPQNELTMNCLPQELRQSFLPKM